MWSSASLKTRAALPIRASSGISGNLSLTKSLWSSNHNWSADFFAGGGWELEILLDLFSLPELLEAEPPLDENLIEDCLIWKKLNKKN